MSGDTACGEFKYDELNEAKVSMDHIYDQPDPRAYFRELKKLDYSIPDAAKPVFQNLVSHRLQQQCETVHILDLGCSYGVNAALLKHDLSINELYRHWSDNGLNGATPEEVVEQGKRYFSKLEERERIEISGLDVAENAVAFAEEVGLLEEGYAINLESEPLSDSASEDLTSVDLVTSTGCIGYVTERSFNHLLPAVVSGRKPWIANFVLRMFPFDTIADTLSDWGYRTEKLEGETFVQRRFASQEEQDQVQEQLLELGIDPRGHETEGFHLAEFYLSRPEKDAKAMPLEQLFAG